MFVRGLNFHDYPAIAHANMVDLDAKFVPGRTIPTKLMLYLINIMIELCQVEVMILLTQERDRDDPVRRRSRHSDELQRLTNDRE